MSRQGLFPVTLATLLFTGVVLTQSGWFTPRAAQAAHVAQRQPEVRRQFRTADASLPEDVVLRWQSGQPSHWRGYMLHK